MYYKFIYVPPSKLQLTVAFQPKMRQIVLEHALKLLKSMGSARSLHSKAILKHNQRRTVMIIRQGCVFLRKIINVLATFITFHLCLFRFF